jgi:hypothetical protein
MLIVTQWNPVPAEPGKTIVQVRKTVRVRKTGDQACGDSQAPMTGSLAAASIRHSSE